MSRDPYPVADAAERRPALRWWTSDRATGLSIALAMLVAFAVVGSRVIRVATGPLPPQPGVAAPAFSGDVLRGGRTTLSQHRGKIVVLDFWATWCPPCVASMPALERLHREHGKRGFVVLGINQEPDSTPRVRRFVERAGLTFPTVVDPGTIAASYGVYSFPTTVLVGPDGLVRQVYRGPTSEARLRHAVEALLDARSQEARPG